MGDEADGEGAAMCSACNDTHHEEYVNLWGPVCVKQKQEDG